MNTAASARGKCASRTVWPIINSLLLFEDATLGPQNFMNAHFCAHIYKEWRVRSLISQAATCTRIACLECIEERSVITQRQQVVVASAPPESSADCTPRSVTLNEAHCRSLAWVPIGVAVIVKEAGTPGAAATTATLRL